MPDEAVATLAELDLSDPEIESHRIQGAIAQDRYVDYVRDLEPSDLEALKLPRGSTPPSLVRIHSTHHALARCLALGMSNNQAAQITGYSASRISILKSDESFKALVEDYRAETKSIVADAQFRMAGDFLMAQEMLHDLMEANPETFTPQMLIEIIKMYADRTGHGPGQKISMDIKKDFIDRPPRESFEEWEKRRGQELKVIDHEAETGPL